MQSKNPGSDEMLSVKLVIKLVQLLSRGMRVINEFVHSSSAVMDFCLRRKLLCGAEFRKLPIFDYSSFNSHTTVIQNSGEEETK